MLSAYGYGPMVSLDSLAMFTSKSVQHVDRLSVVVLAREIFGSHVCFKSVSIFIIILPTVEYVVYM